MLLPAALTLLVALPGAGVQSWSGPPPVQPTSYRSPSGSWTLEVDPTSRLGAGPADYRATNDGEQAWSARLPFTLRGACIDDRGYVAGYGYDQGWNGVVPAGNLLIAVLSPSGEVVAKHEWPTHPGYGIHSPPAPWVAGVVLDEHHGTATFRVFDHDRSGTFEEWRVLDLESGALVDAIRPDERAGSSWSESADATAGTRDDPEEPGPVEAAPIEPIELALVARVDLRATSSPQPGAIRDLVAFGFDGPGRLQAVRLDDRERSVFTCLVLDEEGRVLLERGLEPLDSGEPRRRAWWPLGEGRWLVTPDSLSSAWRTGTLLVDSVSGAIEPRPCRGLTQIEAVASTHDGGYVVLGADFEAPMCLVRYDRSGARLWRTTLVSEPGEPIDFGSADDVAVGPSGRIAVVDPWDDALGLFGPDGTFQERLDLAELWDHDPSYVAHVEADGDEGFLVVEEPSAPIVRRLGFDGRIRASLVPRRADGAKDGSLARSVARAPDGRLWASDGRSLLRLADDGVADRVLGQAPVAAQLDEPWSAAVDPLGRVAILDAGTRALHVFDREGTALFVAQPAPGDFEGRSNEGEIAASFDGGLFVTTRALAGGWLGFDARGDRLGSVDLGGRWRYVPPEVAFSPEPGLFWRRGALVPDGEALLLRGREQHELARIERRRDRRWIESLETFAVAPSGQVAVLEDLPFSGPGCVLSWYDRRGRPLGQLALPRPTSGDLLATSGRWAVVASYEAESLLLCDLVDASVRSFTPPDGWSAARGGIPGFSPDGRELWLVQPSDTALWRLALP